MLLFFTMRLTTKLKIVLRSQKSGNFRTEGMLNSVNNHRTKNSNTEFVF